MTLSIYRASIPVFLRGLDVLSVLLDKAAAHAEARSFDVGILLVLLSHKVAGYSGCRGCSLQVVF